VKGESGDFALAKASDLRPRFDTLKRQVCQLVSGVQRRIANAIATTTEPIVINDITSPTASTT
jgi:hypothetical protein